jgi:hypothetical protein
MSCWEKQERDRSGQNFFTKSKRKGILMLSPDCLCIIALFLRLPIILFESLRFHLKTDTRRITDREVTSAFFSWKRWRTKNCLSSLRRMFFFVSYSLWLSLLSSMFNSRRTITSSHKKRCKSLSQTKKWLTKLKSERFERKLQESRNEKWPDMKESSETLVLRDTSHLNGESRPEKNERLCFWKKTKES